VRWHYFEALFIRNIYKGFIACPSLLEAVGIRVMARNIRAFNTFYLSFLKNKCPSLHCALAAN
jgi:hypothetical protein